MSRLRRRPPSPRAPPPLPSLILLLLLGVCGFGGVVVSVASAEKQTIDLGSLLGGDHGEGGGCPNLCSTHTTPDLRPAPKRRIRPYSNGCSVPPFLRDSLGDYSHFTGCCDLHDTCYMTCGATKGFCDREFGRCMKNACVRKFGRSGPRTRECKGLADTFVLGVSMFGCDGYLGYQKEGCDCVDKSEAVKRVGQYAREFYDAYNATHPLPDAIVQKYLSGEGGEVKDELHGELLYRLYRKYPQSIDIISRDGQSQRAAERRFDLAAGGKSKEGAKSVKDEEAEKERAAILNEA